MRINLTLERILHNWPVKVVSLVAAILLFGFYRISSLEERFFTIPLKVSINDRVVAATEYPKSVRVTIRGRGDDILLILDDDILASADFSKYNTAGTYTVPVKVIRKGAALNASPVEVNVEPSEISLSLVKRMTRSIEIKPSITGLPAKGYELSQFFVTPSAVEIEGAETTIGKMSYIQTEDIDVTSRQSNFTARVRLKKPNNTVSFPGGDIVEFTAVITEVYIVKTMSGLDLIALDLDSAFELDGINQDNTLKIRGKQLELEKYNYNDFRFTVDCSRINKPGEYVLDISPDVPTGILVLNYSPKKITIHVKKSNMEGTP